MTKQKAEVVEHGAREAHDFSGAYLHTVHEASVPSRDLRGQDWLEKNGWTYSHGWYRGAESMKLYTKVTR